ncbi:MAG: DinB family protein [Dehalococcoidia bacterium]
MNEGLAEMLKYTRWANRRLLEACRDLTERQLDAQPAGLSGSIRELFVHLVGGQQTFALRTLGRQHEGELNRKSAWPGFDRLIELVAAADEELVARSRSLDGSETVVLAFMGKRYLYPVRFFLAHSVAHSSEHRTEIKVGLGSIGVATPDLDGWEFAAAQGYGGEV